MKKFQQISFALNVSQYQDSGNSGLLGA